MSYDGLGRNGVMPHYAEYAKPSVSMLNYIRPECQIYFISIVNILHLRKTTQFILKFMLY